MFAPMRLPSVRRRENPEPDGLNRSKQWHEAGDDALIDGPLPSLTKFDEEEWEW